MYGYFERQTDGIAHEKTWTRLQKGNIKGENEAYLTAAHATSWGIFMLKRKSIILKRIASVGYVRKKMKQLIT